MLWTGRSKLLGNCAGYKGFCSPTRAQLLKAPSEGSFKNKEEGTPFGVQLRSLESRVTAMGGIPALGGGLVLPRLTPDGRPQLSTTASPAALEVARARASQGVTTTPLRRVEGNRPRDGEDAPTPVRLPALRAVPRPEERQGLQSTALQADFAAAMARRRAAQGETEAGSS